MIELLQDLVALVMLWVKTGLAILMFLYSEIPIR